MQPKRPDQVRRLEDLPNVGRSTADDLRAAGILQPSQLIKVSPLSVYRRLGGIMGERHDPCVLYTLLAIRHFLDGGEARPWWEFTAEGRRLLSEAAPRPNRRSSGT